MTKYKEQEVAGCGKFNKYLLPLILLLKVDFLEVIST